MNYRYTTTGLVIRLIALIVAISVGSISFYDGAWDIGLIALAAAVFLVFSLIRFVNSVYRTLDFFFDAVRNEDNSIRFPENASHPSLRGMHQNLNRVNEMIAEVRQKQEQSERFFMEFMKRSATGIIALDKAGFVEVANDAALRLTGLRTLTHVDRLAQEQPDLFQAMQGLKTGQSVTVKIPDGGRLRQVSVKMVALQFNEKEFRLYSLYDVRAELEENELETWQKLIRIMTHEIMNSIAPITSLSNTLLAYFQKDGKPLDVSELNQQKVDDAAAGLSVVEERTAGLQNFVEDYRKLTKIPTPVFDAITLEEWLASIRLLFEPRRSEGGIELLITNDYPKATFVGDERLLTHVILNLLNNAADALENMEEKRVEIRTETGEEERLRLTVRDNGIGFQQAALDELFIPFYTTKENGSGIGLSVSKQIMHLHGGSISAHSHSGTSTEFVLDL